MSASTLMGSGVAYVLVSTFGFLARVSLAVFVKIVFMLSISFSALIAVTYVHSFLDATTYSSNDPYKLFEFGSVVLQFLPWWRPDPTQMLHPSVSNQPIIAEVSASQSLIISSIGSRVLKYVGANQIGPLGIIASCLLYMYKSL